MSTRNRLSHRASLRSAAVIEPYSQALAFLRSSDPVAPIVPVPNPSQQFLEGQIFARIRDLHDPFSAGRTFESAIEITRLAPQTDSLDVHVLPEGIASLLAGGILPCWQEGDDVLESGVRGLRYRALRERAVIEFFLLGSPGVVRFVGVPVNEFLEARQRTDRSTYRSVDSLTRLAPQEVQSRFLWHDDAAVMSVLIRRFGLLRRFGPYAIDAWWNRPGRFSVEMLVDRFDRSRFDRLLVALQSSEFSPRFVFRRQDRTRYHTYLQIEGSSLELDLRVQSRD